MQNNGKGLKMKWATVKLQNIICMDNMFLQFWKKFLWSNYALHFLCYLSVQDPVSSFFSNLLGLQNDGKVWMIQCVIRTNYTCSWWVVSVVYFWRICACKLQQSSFGDWVCFLNEIKLLMQIIQMFSLLTLMMDAKVLKDCNLLS